VTILFHFFLAHQHHTKHVTVLVAQVTICDVDVTELQATQRKNDVASDALHSRQNENVTQGRIHTFIGWSQLDFTVNINTQCE